MFGRRVEKGAEDRAPSLCKMSGTEVLGKIISLKLSRNPHYFYFQVKHWSRGFRRIFLGVKLYAKYIRISRYSKFAYVERTKKMSQFLRLGHTVDSRTNEGRLTRRRSVYAYGKPKGVSRRTTVSESRDAQVGRSWITYFYRNFAIDEKQRNGYVSTTHQSDRPTLKRVNFLLRFLLFILCSRVKNIARGPPSPCSVFRFSYSRFTLSHNLFRVRFFFVPDAFCFTSLF